MYSSENVLIEQLIAVTSRLDALVGHKNVLQPMGIRGLMAIKQPSQMKHTNSVNDFRKTIHLGVLWCLLEASWMF